MYLRSLTLVLFWGVSVAAADDPLPMSVDVYVGGTNGYFGYRIPAIETAPDGTLLTFAEARKYNLDDPGFGKQDIDLVLRRSTDKGATWTPMEVLDDPGEYWSAANPTTVVDRDTGRVWLLYLRAKPARNTFTARPGTDDNQLIVRSSEDSGRSWSEPRDVTEITRDMNDSQWRVSVIGPGGAIQDRNGRLIAPAWKYEPFRVFAIYSDDHGQSWHRGPLVQGEKNVNESQLVALSDGRVLVDMRQNEGEKRWMAVSRDRGVTWDPAYEGNTVTPVACAIERLTAKSAGDDRDRILWTGPKGPGRNKLVLRVSYDEGKTFQNERLISPEPAAYSDLTVLTDKSVGCLWERANCRFITFTRFDLAFIEPK